MKLNLRTAALLAIAGVALSTNNAKAISAATGDLALGFSGLDITNGSVQTNFEINIGNASLYTLKDGSTFTLPGLTIADLATTYGNGTSWFTGGTVSWGVVANISKTGTGANVNTTLLGTVTATAPGNGTPVNQSLGSAEAQAFTKISGVYSGLTGTAGYNGSTTEVKLLSSNPNSFDTNKGTGATYFSYFPNTAITGTVGPSGTSYLDLYRLVGTPTTSTGSGEYLGTFSLTSSSASFASAVPEPSTYAMLVIGAGFLVMAVRRKNQRKSAVNA